MKIIKTGFFTICLILINFVNVFAQGEEMPEPTGPPEQPPNYRVPIDDHLMFLIIAGVILGITLIYRNKIRKASI